MTIRSRSAARAALDASHASASAPAATGRSRAFELELEAELAELPARVRSLFTKHAGAAETLSHLAEGVQALFDELSTDSPSDELRRAASLLCAHAEHAGRTVHDLMQLAGELKGLAWVLEAREQAQFFAEREREP